MTFPPRRKLLLAGKPWNGKNLYGSVLAESWTIHIWSPPYCCYTKSILGVFYKLRRFLILIRDVRGRLFFELSLMLLVRIVGSNNRCRKQGRILNQPFYKWWARLTQTALLSVLLTNEALDSCSYSAAWWRYPIWSYQQKMKLFCF